MAQITVEVSRTFRVREFESLKLTAGTVIEIDTNNPTGIARKQQQLMQVCRQSVYKEAAAQLGKNARLKIYTKKEEV